MSGLLPSWWHGCWRSYRVYTFREGSWGLLVDPISTHCNQWDQGVDAISKDPTKPGYVTVRFTDGSQQGFAIGTKSIGSGSQSPIGRTRQGLPVRRRASGLDKLASQPAFWRGEEVFAAGVVGLP